MLVSEDGFDGLEIEWGTAAVDERLKHLFNVPAHLKDQVSTVFDLIVGVLIMEPAALLFVEVEGEASIVRKIAGEHGGLLFGGERDRRFVIRTAQPEYDT